jgi:hypothetical protein
MSMGWKARRVAQLFGLWLWDSFVTELLRFRFLFTAVLIMQNSALHFNCDQLGA